MKYLLVSSFFGFILLVSLNSYFDEKLQVTDFIPKGKLLVLSPLDVILGEKKMDDGSFRKDNFQSILQLKASYLKDSSQLYKVQPLTKDLFLLTRKKFYYNNRSYSLFVKTRGDRIVFCHPIIGFPIKGVVYSDEKIYFIGDDYSEIPNPWKPSYSVKITCVDLNFMELWKTVSDSDYYFFFATGLSLKENVLHAQVELHGQGSTMCTDIYDVELTNSGKVTGSKFIGTHACMGRNVHEVDDVSAFFK